MNGGYTKPLRCAIWTVECEKLSGGLHISFVEKKALKLSGENQYHLHINSKSNKACPTLVSSLFLLKDANACVVNEPVLLQYHIMSGEEKVEFKVTCHGNSRNSANKPFYLTARSTLDAIKQKVKEDTAAHVYNDVKKEVGGPSRARTPGSLPRSLKQVSDIKVQAKRSDDPVEELLVYARKKDEKIIFHHQDMPADLWVLGTDVMYVDIGKFTSCEQLSHPISIDPTFDMGQFEVTPVVYRHVFLTSKRTGNNSIFLGPTMIHHRKDFQTYKVLSLTCVAACKGLEKCRGHITDGETALEMPWKSDLPKATSLRCVKHFEGNCKAELYKTGIWEKKSQKFFLDRVFGVHGKEEGIVDAEDKKEVKQTLQSLRDDFDEKEVELLQENNTYKPQFSKYLEDKRELIGKKMALKYRRQAGLPNDAHGKPIRPYTNSSEAMNHVMSQTKVEYPRANGRKQNGNLSKLEFTRHVLEEIHQGEQEELKLALCRLSEKYQLTNVAAHLLVPVETWFDQTEIQRDESVKKVNAMSVEDMLKGKRVSVGTADKTSTCLNREFQELSFDAAKVLREKNICPEDIITAVIEGAVTLLNLPAAIQQKATLDAYKVTNTFEVASRDAKNGKVECTVNKDHVKCRCHSFKYDSVCKHSIAIAERVGMLEEHISHITKSSRKKGQRTTLAEANVNKAVAGKKGSTCRYPYRPQLSVQRQSVTERASKQPASHMYTQIHHNDNPFVLRILPKDAKNCKQCKNDFWHRLRVVPHDLVFEHKNRFHFPLNGDWKNKQVSNREATRYYHADYNCMKARFPYITNDYIEIPPDVRAILHESHKAHLREQFLLD